MSQYLCVENQKMLWNVFQRMSIARSISEQQMEVLFKQAIGSLYEPTQIYTKTSLQELNKTTILTLKQYCLEYHQEKQEPFENAQDKMARQFQEKQKEYDELTAKPNVPKPSELFQEKQTDGVITNMDELLKQYQEQRDRDLRVDEKEEVTKVKGTDIWEYVRALENRLTLLSEEVKELRLKISI
jgi:HD-GYP domain-containing protein (c-di-GMP phosphodiesterase class II)